MVDSARRIGGRRGEGGRVRWFGAYGGGRKNGRSRGTEPRRGSHASTPITRDSLTIGFPLAVTEIYRKPVHLVLRALDLRDEADSRFRICDRGRLRRVIRVYSIAEKPEVGILELFRLC